MEKIIMNIRRAIGYIPWNKGKIGLYKHTEEAKRKIKENHKGTLGKHWVLSDKSKDNMSLAKIGKKMSEQCKEKHRVISRTHIGCKSHNWKGGIYPFNERLRHHFKYRQWRSDVFTRDNWTCQECGKRGGKLEAHHKKEFSKIITEYAINTMEKALLCEELWDINNGETLCREDHDKTKRKN